MFLNHLSTNAFEVTSITYNYINGIISVFVKRKKSKWSTHIYLMSFVKTYRCFSQLDIDKSGVRHSCISTMVFILHLNVKDIGSAVFHFG